MHVAKPLGICLCHQHKDVSDVDGSGEVSHREIPDQQAALSLGLPELATANKGAFDLDARGNVRVAHLSAATLCAEEACISKARKKGRCLCTCFRGDPNDLICICEREMSRGLSRCVLRYHDQLSLVNGEMNTYRIVSVNLMRGLSRGKPSYGLVFEGRMGGLFLPDHFLSKPDPQFAGVLVHLIKDTSRLSVEPLRTSPPGKKPVRIHPIKIKIFHYTMRLQRISSVFVRLNGRLSEAFPQGFGELIARQLARLTERHEPGADFFVDLHSV